MKTKRTNYLLTLVTLLALLCLQNGPVIGQTVYALSNNKLYFFQADNPEEVTFLNRIKGIAPGQKLVGMDFRPNTGELFALGYNASSQRARLYIINVITAVATPVGTSTIKLELGAASGIGFDFNPTVDRIRVVSANGANYRLNPITGGIAFEDGDLKFASTDRNAGVTPRVVAGAYTNSFIGATTTTLYDIDLATGSLVIQNPPNDGVLNTVARLNIPFNSKTVADIDIAYDDRYNSLLQSNPAYLVVSNSSINKSLFYWLNIVTVETRFVDTIGINGIVEDIAIRIRRVVPQAVQGNLVYAVTTNNNLISFDSDRPGVVRSLVTISGIATGQTLVGTDFRPNTGELFGLGYNGANGESRLYTINLQTGVATPVGTATFTLALGAGPIGFDFNPTVDRIRVEGANRKNYRLNPVTGGIAATDLDLKFAATDINAAKTPFIGSVAYTNSFIGTATTTLYAYDDQLNILALQNPPNDGVLNTVGTSGITVSSTDYTSDLDIAFNSTNNTNTAFLVANIGNWDSNFDNFYTINLQTGAATLVGRVGLGIPIRDIAVFIQLRATNASLIGDLIYAVTTNNNLISFDSKQPDAIRSLVAITGTAVGQMLVGTDFRPNTGELFGLGYNSTNGEARLYTINLQTGVATAVGMAPITLDLGTAPIGFDFNPTVDRIRVEGTNRKNYRLNPVTGGIAATDLDLKFAAADQNASQTPTIGSVAYTNSFIGSTATTLYAYDDRLNVLATQNPPNDGVLNTVGTSGVTVSTTDATSDLDITFNATTNVNTAYLVTNSTGANDTLYTINLQTGATTKIGRIGFGLPIRDIAVVINRPALGAVQGQLAYTLTSNSLLLTFDTKNPSIIRSSKGITGLVAGQTVVGIDFRPATGELWALGYNRTNGQASLYTLDTAGVLVSKSPTPVTLDLGTGAISFDFNPVVDRIRVVGENGRNYRLNPLTGGIAATDLNLKFAAADPNAAATPRIGASAYTNSFNTTTATVLYNYDLGLNRLTTQNPPNDGVLNTVGASGISVNATNSTVGLDIFYDFDAKTNTAYLAANRGTSLNDSLYTVNLQTGAVTLVGRIGSGSQIISIAIPIDSVVATPAAGRIAFNATAPTPATFSAVPNPGRDEIRIQLSEEMRNVGFTIQLSDMTGQILLKQVERGNSDNFLRWDASQLTSGMYFITVLYTDGRVETQKWMRQ